MSTFHFKKFSVRQDNSALKVGTDAMILGSLIETTGKETALDIGSGTGVLSLMQAQKNPILKISSIEIDSNSCKDSRYNFSQSSFSERLKLIEGDFLNQDFINKFDLIFSNPPFYTDALLAEDFRINQAKHSGELNGFNLCEKASDLLTNTGAFWLIWPFQTRNFILKCANDSNLFPAQEITLEGKPNSPVRSIFCFAKVKPTSFLQSTILIRDADGNYSEQYKRLTKDFHNKEL